MKSKSFLMAMLLVIAMSVSITSCTKEETPDVPQDVIFTLNYTFAESGSMTRATGAEVYNEFYDSYIKTKRLTPTTYSLTFTNKESGAEVAVVKGTWTEKEGIRLPEGTYHVEGTSERIYTGGSIDAASEYVSDTVFIKFDEDIALKENQTELTLTAKYDSYLLMLDATNIKSVTYTGIKNWNFGEADDLKYLFVQRASTVSKTEDRINITRDNNKVTIYVKKLPFEKGKYYYFNDMTNSFDLPPMESGN